ncbi:MAG: hypothetical protein ACLQPD_35295 [Desulfomonilaceae bacterium]
MPRGRNQERVFDCPTSVKFPCKQVEEFKIEAKIRGLTLSEAIRQAVLRWMTHRDNYQGKDQ